MTAITIAVLNLSTALTDARIEEALPALQTQISRDFALVYRTDAHLVFVPKTGRPPAGAWWLGVFDNSDQPGALGYHDLTPEGRPFGKVFAATDLAAGLSWTVTMSHELLEMLADPDINITIFYRSSGTAGRLYAYEVCDAPEADAYGYTIDGVLVSDFVYPAWFQDTSAGDAQFDHAGHIKAPLELLPGGYIGVFDLSGSGWIQLHPTGAELHYRDRPRVGSRRERRRTPREQWLRSTVTY
ncbi:MAG: hypothetical protein QOE54_497 [Streptosporangiaceae bacterium]|jgi:hypothetical protein|nr:hypothetical protein [Streptosporangiaceae bacterium]MDX6428131.1 hypothetical protein [Streptosporangiaceae bacterium]